MPFDKGGISRGVKFQLVQFQNLKLKLYNCSGIFKSITIIDPLHSSIKVLQVYPKIEDFYKDATCIEAQFVPLNRANGWNPNPNKGHQQKRQRRGPYVSKGDNQHNNQVPSKWWSDRITEWDNEENRTMAKGDQCKTNHETHKGSEDTVADKLSRMRHVCRRRKPKAGKFCNKKNGCLLNEVDRIKRVLASSCLAPWLRSINVLIIPGHVRSVENTVANCLSRSSVLSNGICLRGREQEIGKVLKSKKGCLYSRLDKLKRLRSPTHSYYSKSFGKGIKRGFHSYNSGPKMGISKQVANAIKDDSFRNIGPSKGPIRSRHVVSEQQQNLGVDCCEDIRKSLSRKGFREEAINLVLQKWKSTTLNSLKSNWKKWAAYCEEVNHDRMVQDEVVLSNFITHLLATETSEVSNSILKAASENNSRARYS
eukprot:gene3073-3842_t